MHLPGKIGPSPDRLRVVTINFWGNEAPLTQRLSLARRQLEELQPDVIGMQEVRPLNGKTGQTSADFLAEALGFSCVYKVAQRWNDDDFFPGHPGGEEGLALLSRFPIGQSSMAVLPEARPKETRILLSAAIDARCGQVWCHTTHLHYRLDDGRARERQVVAVDEVIRNTQTSQPQVLCGDFNATPEHDEIRFLRGLTTLEGRRTHYQDAFARVHPQDPGLTWCAENPQTRPLRSLDIDRRIDYIFVTSRSKDGAGTVLDAGLALHRRDENGVCASDHYGVFADVQLRK